MAARGSEAVLAAIERRRRSRPGRRGSAGRDDDPDEGESRRSDERRRRRRSGSHGSPDRSRQRKRSASGEVRKQVSFGGERASREQSVRTEAAESQPQEQLDQLPVSRPRDRSSTGSSGPLVMAELARVLAEERADAERQPASPVRSVPLWRLGPSGSAFDYGDAGPPTREQRRRSTSPPTAVSAASCGTCVDSCARSSAGATSECTCACSRCADTSSRRSGAGSSTRGSSNAEPKVLAAYEMSRDLLRDRLSTEDAETLAAVTAEDVVVVAGHYDRMEHVLRQLQIPFKRVLPLELAKLSLPLAGTVFVNCALRFSHAHVQRLKSFVHAGGTMVTSDWAVRNVLQRAWPGLVEASGRETMDDVVRVRATQNPDPVVAGFADEAAGAAQPVWWLERGSLPIRVLDRRRVRVLLESEEMHERYGNSEVLVAFDAGAGTVYHCVSHVMIARTEPLAPAQTQPAAVYARSKRASEATLTRWAAETDRYADVDYGTMQSAQTASEFAARVVLRQQVRASESRGDGGGRRRSSHAKRASTASAWSTTPAAGGSGV